MRRLYILLLLSGFTQIAAAQFSSASFVNGAYYDTKGARHSGLLAWTTADETTNTPGVIYFKADANAGKIEIPINAVTGFVTSQYGNIDSAIISKNPAFSRKPILAVVASKNAVKLYQSITFKMSKAIRGADGKIRPPSKIIQVDYYFGPGDLQLTLLTESNFQEAIMEAMADNKEAMARIKDKNIGFKDMATLVYVYKNGSLPPTSSPAPATKSTQ